MRRFHHLDLNLLVVLDALLSECNITRAGQRLHLSQPATSSALARLRDYFEDELLVQIGRKMVPTPLGESLITPIRSMLLQLQATLEKRPEFAPAASDRKFSFVMSDYTAMVLMPAVIHAASQVAPGVGIELLTPGDSPQEELERGNVDFLLMPRQFLNDPHPSCAVFTEEFVCVCWTGNRLLGDSLSLDQYLSMGHVVVRFGTQRVPSVDEWLIKRQGVERRIEVVATTFSAVPHYLVGNQRIATIHRRLANLWARSLPIKILPPPLAIPTLEWGLQWHQYRDLDPGTQWMRKLILDTARTLDTPLFART